MSKENAVMIDSKKSEFVAGGDLVLYNGKIHTLEVAQPLVEAVAIREGRLVYAGSSQKALANNPKAQAVDLVGRFVLPGFIDSHVHFWRTGLMEQMVDLRSAKRI